MSDSPFVVLGSIFVCADKGYIIFTVLKETYVTNIDILFTDFMIVINDQLFDKLQNDG